MDLLNELEVQRAIYLTTRNSNPLGRDCLVMARAAGPKKSCQGWARAFNILLILFFNSAKLLFENWFSKKLYIFAFALPNILPEIKEWGGSLTNQMGYFSKPNILIYSYFFRTWVFLLQKYGFSRALSWAQTSYFWRVNIHLTKLNLGIFSIYHNKSRCRYKPETIATHFTGYYLLVATCSQNHHHEGKKLLFFKYFFDFGICP